MKHSDPYTAHFVSPDSVVPEQYNSQDWDRYAYSRSNPLKYSDPSGHEPVGNCYDRGYCDNNPDIVEPPKKQSYHQCMIGCHQGEDPEPTNYVDIKIDPRKIDGVSLFSNSLGLIGDGVTVITILNGPIIGDEIVAGAGFTELNASLTGINLFGVAADIYYQDPLSTIRDGTLTFANLPSILSNISRNASLGPLGKIIPLASTPFHFQGVAQSFKPGFIYTIPLGDAP